jgi:hypothetical protein
VRDGFDQLFYLLPLPVFQLADRRDMIAFLQLLPFRRRQRQSVQELGYVLLGGQPLTGHDPVDGGALDPRLLGQTADVDLMRFNKRL